MDREMQNNSTGFYKPVINNRCYSNIINKDDK
jgi:hypothetical protein